MKISIKINLLIFFVMLLIVSPGCNSDDDMEMEIIEYYVRANVDGVFVEFENEEALDGSLWTNNGLFNSDLFGGRLEGGQTVTESITINLLRQSSPIAETTYTGYGASTVGLTGVLIIYAFDNIDVEYVTDITNADSSLEFTEITPSHLKGKFSGVVRNFLNDEIKTISNGEFFVPRRE